MRSAEEDSANTEYPMLLSWNPQKAEPAESISMASAASSMATTWGVNLGD